MPAGRRYMYLPFSCRYENPCLSEADPQSAYTPSSRAGNATRIPTTVCIQRWQEKRAIITASQKSIERSLSDAGRCGQDLRTSADGD